MACYATLVPVLVERLHPWLPPPLEGLHLVHSEHAAAHASHVVSGALPEEIRRLQNFLHSNEMDQVVSCVALLHVSVPCNILIMWCLAAISPHLTSVRC